MNKWLNPEIYDREKVAYQNVLEQLLKDLEENTQNWVRRHLLQNCKEALKLAEAFAFSENESTRERILTTMGTP